MKTKRLQKILLSASLMMAAGCSDMGSEPDPTPPDPPAPDPTWDESIGELLTNQCGACHGATPANGAPGGFRLDRYDRADAGGTTDGAFEMRTRIQARSVAGSSMPPAAPLSTADRAELEAWLEAGAPRS